MSKGMHRYSNSPAPSPSVISNHGATTGAGII